MGVDRVGDGIDWLLPLGIKYLLMLLECWWIRRVRGRVWMVLTIATAKVRVFGSWLYSNVFLYPFLHSLLKLVDVTFTSQLFIQLVY